MGTTPLRSFVLSQDLEDKLEPSRDIRIERVERVEKKETDTKATPQIHTNAFYRFDEDEGGQVGMFLEPTLAMANHSCIPNATVLFMQREALLLAERPIQAGDEIEISYTGGFTMTH